MKRLTSLTYSILLGFQRLLGSPTLFLLAAISAPAGAQTVDDFTTTIAILPDAIALQPDGAVLVGGYRYDSVFPPNMLRFSPGGLLDPSFNVTATRGGYQGVVICQSMLQDGKILIAGRIDAVSGYPRTAVTRLNKDGTVDPSFDSSCNDEVYSMVIDLQGRIVVGGNFTVLNGQTRTRLGRLNEDGSLDQDFNPATDESVSCLALQPDGRILVGGMFSTLNGHLRRGLARLNADGTVDSTFSPGVNSEVHCIGRRTDFF